MLTYELHQGGAVLHRRLYDCIREDILSGRLKAGEKLPSKRVLAAQNAVSTITVETAYAQLVAEGYLIPKPRSGYYVSDLGDLSVLRLQQGGNAEPGRPGEKKDARTALEDHHWFADFASNQTSPDSFPFSIWARLSREVLSHRKQELMTNPPSGGVWELRSAIASYLASFRGLNISPDQVIIGAGTEYLYGLLIQLLGFDLCYASENPGYRKVSQICEAYGVKTIPISLDRDGLNVAALRESGAQVVHVTPSHHFPTGITMPVSRRYELLAWALEDQNRYILEDDYDSEFRLQGRPLPTLCQMDEHERVIYLNTFTKSLASTIRVSYMVLPGALLDRMNQKLPFYSCSVSTFEQYTLAAFLREGYFEKHINRMRNDSRKRRNCLLEAIRESALRDEISISEENAGLHFLMNIRPKNPDAAREAQFQEGLQRNGIRMISLDAFADGSVLGPFLPGDGILTHTYLMNYSSVPEERIPEAVARICAAAR